MDHLNTNFHNIINKNFSKAYEYDNYALIQKIIAKDFFNFFHKFYIINSQINILEIGAGTGFLTELIIKNISNINYYLCTDISSPMLDRAKTKLNFVNKNINIEYKILNGENFNLPQKFDLIISNLTFQWFINIESAIKNSLNHLSPHGILLFSTLGENSFYEWKNAHYKLNFQPSTPNFISQEFYLTNINWQIINHKISNFIDIFPTLHEFLISLKKIGAETNKTNNKSLTRKEFNTVIQYLGGLNAPFCINYETLYFIIHE